MVNILVPTDFSALSKIAVQYAVKIANKLDGTITLLHVITITAPVRNSMHDKMRNLEEDLVRFAERDLKKLIGEISKTLKTSEPIACSIVRSSDFQDAVRKEAVVSFRQTDFMKTKDLGFNKDELLVFPAVRNAGMSLPAFKSELLKVAGVKQVTSVSSLPGRLMGSHELRPYNTHEEENIKIGWLSIDHDYIPTLQLTLLAGRNFHANGSDEKTGIVINETAATALGCYPVEKAVGKAVSGFIFSDSVRGEVIGVVKDFHASSLRREIVPMALCYGTTNNRYMVRLDGTELSEVQAQVNAAVKKLIPGKPFESMLMDDHLDSVYMPENKTGQLLTFFAILAIGIGCLGLYALSAYEGEQRTKELGLRKIMGATTLQLLAFLSKGFMKLVLISLFVAIPLAWFLANIWLHSFPYHMRLSTGLFLQSAFAILLLAWFTIATHAIKAAGLNPVDALRHE